MSVKDSSNNTNLCIFIMKRVMPPIASPIKLLDQSIPTTYPDSENTTTFWKYLPAVLHYVSAKDVVTVWRFVFLQRIFIIHYSYTSFFPVARGKSHIARLSEKTPDIWDNAGRLSFFGGGLIPFQERRCKNSGVLIFFAFANIVILSLTSNHFLKFCIAFVYTSRNEGVKCYYKTFPNTASNSSGVSGSRLIRR